MRTTFQSARLRTFAAMLLAAASSVITVTSTSAEEYLNGIKWPEPPIVTPGATNAEPPSDAIVLFNGKTSRTGKMQTHGRSKGTRWFVASRRSHRSTSLVIANCTLNGPHQRQRLAAAKVAATAVCS